MFFLQRRSGGFRSAGPVEGGPLPPFLEEGPPSLLPDRPPPALPAPFFFFTMARAS